MAQTSQRVELFDMLVAGMLAAVIGALTLYTAGLLLDLHPDSRGYQIAVLAFGIPGFFALHSKMAAWIPVILIAAFLGYLAIVEGLTDGLRQASGFALPAFALISVTPALRGLYRLSHFE